MIAARAENQHGRERVGTIGAEGYQGALCHQVCKDQGHTVYYRSFYDKWRIRFVACGVAITEERGLT